MRNCTRLRTRSSDFLDLFPPGRAGRVRTLKGEEKLRQATLLEVREELRLPPQSALFKEPDACAEWVVSVASAACILEAAKERLLSRIEGIGNGLLAVQLKCSL